MEVQLPATHSPGKAYSQENSANLSLQTQRLACAREILCGRDVLIFLRQNLIMQLSMAFNSHGAQTELKLEVQILLLPVLGL